MFFSRRPFAWILPLFPVLSWAQLTLEDAPKPAVPVAPAPSASPAVALPPGVFARVNNRDFKVEDVKPYFASLSEEQRVALAGDPAKLREFLRAFFVQQLLLDEAYASGWDQRPEVQVQLKRIYNNAVADSYLAAKSKPPSDYPSDKEVADAYEANKAALQAPRQIRLGLILIAVPKGANEKENAMAKAKVDLVVKALKEPGADFAKIAAEKSSDAKSAARGGEVGWVSEKQIPEAFRAQGMALAKDQISAPIRVPEGWLILKALDERPASTRTLEEVRPILTARLRDARQAEAGRAYVGAFLPSKGITLDESTIKDLLK